MAIYHLNYGTISRSRGKTAVQHAAYITGLKLRETRRNLMVNHQRRQKNIVYTDTLTPASVVPAWGSDVDQIWDRLESFEDTYADTYYKTLATQEKHKSCAQTAITIEVALPRELSLDISKELVEAFANTRFVSRGLVVTYAIYRGKSNPHAHFLISRRCLNEKGEFSWTKDREICKRLEIKVTRKLWADLTNYYLEREGFDDRITEKSFAELGINLLPTKHQGGVAGALTAKGIASRLFFENSEVMLENRLLLLKTPEVIMRELSARQAKFTQQDLWEAIQKRGEGDSRWAQSIFEGALQFCVVTENTTYEDKTNKNTYYTSVYYREREKGMNHA